MPSPFPGMDLYIESQKWGDFHLSAIGVIRELLAPQVADRYVVNIEERVYVEDAQGDDLLLVPDLDVLETGGESFVGTSAASVATTVAPVECLLPEPEPRRQGYLEIRTADGNRLITIIELLSPTNKLPESGGRRKYLNKRNVLLQTRVSLVEIDLLRGGSRLPMASRLPEGDYFALVSRGRHRPRCIVYAWKISDRMPSIPIPLSRDASEPLLDLQTVLNLVYDRGVYRLSLKYNWPVNPPIADAEERWLKSIVAGANSTSLDA